MLRYLHRTQPGLFTWIYAIQAGERGPIKIGRTENPAQRLVTLQQGNAERLRGIAAWVAVSIEEKQLHQEFADVRLHGEWFQPVCELVELVTALGGDFCDWEL